MRGLAWHLSENSPVGVAWIGGLPTALTWKILLLQVRGDEKWLPAKFAALQELSLRGRPRSFMVPPSCTTLSLAYHVSRTCTVMTSICILLFWHGIQKAPPS